MVKPLNILVIIPVLMIFQVFHGCGLKPGARGNLKEIIVFADPDVYQKCEKPLSDALEIIVNTPQPETIFTLKPVSQDKFADSTIATNIVMIGTLEGDGKFSKYIQNMMDTDTRKGIEDGVYWFFAKNNAWYAKQLLLVAVANDAEELASRIQFGGEEIFQVLNQSVLDRMSDMLYKQMENTKLADELRQKYGFSLRIQHDYIMVREEPESRFIRLRRYNPSRWLTVSWMETDCLMEEMPALERARFSALFADPTKIEPDYNKISPDARIIPGGYLLRGLWATEAYIGGGPFFTFAVFDEESGKAYFIDGAVFNPADEKLPYLRQLEVMALTFSVPANTKNE